MANFYLNTHRPNVTNSNVVWAFTSKKARNKATENYNRLSPHGREAETVTAKYASVLVKDRRHRGGIGNIFAVEECDLWGDTERNAISSIEEASDENYFGEWHAFLSPIHSI